MGIRAQFLLHPRSVGLGKARGGGFARGSASSPWILQRRRVPRSHFPLMSLLGLLPVVGLKALSRTPVIVTLGVLLLSVVVLVTVIAIQTHQKEVLLPGLKVSVKGLALEGRDGLWHQRF